MEIRIGDRVADVQLLSKEGNNVHISIDGVEYEVDVAMVERGGCSVLYAGKSYNAEFVRSDNGKNYKVNTNFSTYDVEIIDSSAKYLRMKKGSDELQDNKIVSPMPGKIVSVPVQVGDGRTRWMFCSLCRKILQCGIRAFGQRKELQGEYQFLYL